MKRTTGTFSRGFDAWLKKAEYFEKFWKTCGPIMDAAVAENPMLDETFMIETPIEEWVPKKTKKAFTKKQQALFEKLTRQFSRTLENYTKLKENCPVFIDKALFPEINSYYTEPYWDDTAQKVARDVGVDVKLLKGSARDYIADTGKIPEGFCNDHLPTFFKTQYHHLCCHYEKGLKEQRMLCYPHHDDFWISVSKRWAKLAPRLKTAVRWKTPSTEISHLIETKNNYFWDYDQIMATQFLSDEEVSNLIKDTLRLTPIEETQLPFDDLLIVHPFLEKTELLMLVKQREDGTIHVDTCQHYAGSDDRVEHMEVMPFTLCYRGGARMDWNEDNYGLDAVKVEGWKLDLRDKMKKFPGLYAKDRITFGESIFGSKMAKLYKSLGEKPPNPTWKLHQLDMGWVNHNYTNAKMVSGMNLHFLFYRFLWLLDGDNGLKKPVAGKQPAMVSPRVREQKIRPMYEHTCLTINPTRAEPSASYYTDVERETVPNRFHAVRGHWRTYKKTIKSGPHKGKTKVWVDPHGRGDPDAGYVEHSYHISLVQKTTEFLSELLKKFKKDREDRKRDD